MTRAIGMQSPIELQHERGSQVTRPLQEGISQVFPSIQRILIGGSIHSNLEMRLSALEEKVRKISELSIGFVKINLLPNKTLSAPLDAIVEPDGEGFTARTIDLPLYGHGDDPKESIEMLKREIESLYEDLMEDDNFSDEWLRIKKFLVERITE